MPLPIQSPVINPSVVRLFHQVLWLHHGFPSSDGAAALIAISAIRFHHPTHGSWEGGQPEAQRARERERERWGGKTVVCSWLIQVRTKKKKVMEGHGTRPLLPIHKHDLWTCGQRWLCQHVPLQGVWHVFCGLWVKHRTWKSLGRVCSPCPRCAWWGTERFPPRFFC